MSSRLARIYEEAIYAAAQFSKSRPRPRAKVDPDEGHWVLFYDFPLPRGYNDTTTDILILLPPAYPDTPPQWFYLDQGLQRADGKPLPHHFEVTSHVPEYYRSIPPGMKKWAGGCLHIKSWRPSADSLGGHSLLTVCKLIEEAFQRWLCTT